MAYVVRKRTSGIAQELYNDLVANLANLSQYEDYCEFERDNELAAMLAAWLMLENENETPVDE